MASASYTPVADNPHDSCELAMNSEQCSDTVPITEDHVSAVPIAFREVLYDLHLRKNQRFFCIGATLLICILVLVLFLFLLICFNRVIKKLEVEQHEVNQGLRMVPDFDSRSGNGIVSLARDKMAKAGYVESIQEYLEAYKKEQASRENFITECNSIEKPSHAWCRFPLEVFDAAGCTALNRYGFDNGEPCFLFELKLQSSWSPMFTRNVSALPLQCDVYDQITMRKNTGVKVISALSDRSMAGFPVNKIPSRTISDSKGRDVSDENGETLYDQPALVFVRVQLGRSVHSSVRCFLPKESASTTVLNFATMPGRRSISFDVFYPYAQ